MAFSLNSNALTQVNDCKAIIDIASAITTWDQTFIELINGCTAWIEGYVGGRTLGGAAVQSLVETYDSNEDPTSDEKQHWLTLDNYPCTAISLVEYRTGTSTYSTVDSTAYETYLDRGMIYFYGGVPRGKKSVRVTYTAGYVINWTTQASHTLPYDLTLACRKMVLKEFSKRKAQGITLEAVGGGRIDWNEEVDPGILDILKGYRRILL